MQPHMAARGADVPAVPPGWSPFLPSPSTSELSQWVHEDEFRGGLIQEWKSCAWKGYGRGWQLCRSLLALQGSALFHGLKGKIY